VGRLCPPSCDLVQLCKGCIKKITKLSITGIITQTSFAVAYRQGLSYKTRTVQLTDDGRFGTDTVHVREIKKEMRVGKREPEQRSWIHVYLIR
jgi:hypothetical protein